MWSKWSKLSKRAKGLLVLGILLALLAAVMVWLGAVFLAPYLSAKNTMDPNGILTIYAQEDGSLLAQWPAGENAESYTLEILRLTDAGEERLYAYTTEAQCSCALPELPTDEELTLRVTSGHGYRGKNRPGEECLEGRLKLEVPGISQLDWHADADTDLLNISFQLTPGDVCRVYSSCPGEEAQLVTELTQGKTTLTFGDGAQFAIPTYDTSRTFTFQVYRQNGNVAFYGNTCGEFTVCREDFLGTVLEMKCAEAGNNSYTMSWNETKGEYYEIQYSVDGMDWQTVYKVPKTGERSYTTGHLDAFKNYRFRVTAHGEDSEYAAEAAEVSVATVQRTLYSTIWPIASLDVYGDTDRSQVIGTVPAGSAYCVLEEAEGLFGIRFDNTVGYIDSNYCMINLPEYMGDLCTYQITNSYDSAYMVHEFAIDQVTGKVIQGYKHVKVGADQYLVPLLYPAARKLLSAALAAQEQGCRLKLYDTYRPKEATLSIYNLAEQIIHEQIPRSAFSGKALLDLGELEWDLMGEIPSWVITGTTNGASGTAPEEGAQYLMEGLTYQILMTDNGRYLLANFLGKGSSNHNIGVALDLTLETLSGKELEMQTSMHDLSWYSELKRNNENADMLKSIMVQAGFGTLDSEWWHFQDNDAKAELTLKPLYHGISPQCWMKDDQGWRYRQSNGKYLTGCTKTVDGVTYIFDENGYAAEQ